MDCKSFLKARINKKVYLTSKDKILHKYILSVDDENDTVTTITNIVKPEARKDMNGNNISVRENEKEEKPTTIKIKIIDNWFDYLVDEVYFAKHTGNLKGIDKSGTYKRDIITVSGPFISFDKEIKYNHKKQYSLIGTLTSVHNFRVYISSIETSDFLHNRTIDELNLLCK